MGIAGTLAKAAEVAALTWAGSQVTKLPRAAAAVVLTPLVDHLLKFLQGACSCCVQQHSYIAFIVHMSVSPAKPGARRESILWIS